MLRRRKEVPALTWLPWISDFTGTYSCLIRNKCCSANACSFSFIEKSRIQSNDTLAEALKISYRKVKDSAKELTNIDGDIKVNSLTVMHKCSAERFFPARTSCGPPATACEVTFFLCILETNSLIGVFVCCTSSIYFQACGCIHRSDKASTRATTLSHLEGHPG